MSKTETSAVDDTLPSYARLRADIIAEIMTALTHPYGNKHNKDIQPIISELFRVRNEAAYSLAAEIAKEIYQIALDFPPGSKSPYGLVTPEKHASWVLAADLIVWPHVVARPNCSPARTQSLEKLRMDLLKKGAR